MPKPGLQPVRCPACGTYSVAMVRRGRGAWWIDCPDCPHPVAWRVDRALYRLPSQNRRLLRGTTHPA